MVAQTTPMMTATVRWNAISSTSISVLRRLYEYTGDQIASVQLEQGLTDGWKQLTATQVVRQEDETTTRCKLRSPDDPAEAWNGEEGAKDWQRDIVVWEDLVCTHGSQSSHPRPNDAMDAARNSQFKTISFISSNLSLFN